MEVILFVAVALYSIFLNIRIRETQEEVLDLNLQLNELDISCGNRILSINKDIKKLSKTKKVEKSRRRSTKRSSKVS